MNTTNVFHSMKARFGVKLAGQMARKVEISAQVVQKMYEEDSATSGCNVS